MSASPSLPGGSSAAAPSKEKLIEMIGMVLLLAGLLAARAAGAVEVERVRSPGGIEAWLVQDHTNPIIALELEPQGLAVLGAEFGRGAVLGRGASGQGGLVVARPGQRLEACGGRPQRRRADRRVRGQ